MSNPSGPHTGQVWKGVNTGCAVRGVLIGQGTDPVAVVEGGTSGQVLTSNGENADPTWQDGGGPGGIPSTLSGAQTAIETETLGISLSDTGGGITKSFELAIYDGKPLLSAYDLRVTATHYIHLQAAVEMHLYVDTSSIRLRAGTDLSAVASGGIVLQALGTAGVDLNAETIDLTLTNGGSSQGMEFSLYGGANIIVNAAGANVYHKAGGNFAASAAAMAKIQGASGVQIVTASGPISLTPSNSTQAIHLQNRVSADSWPTADPSIAGQLWVDTASDFVVKVSQG